MKELRKKSVLKLLVSNILVFSIIFSNISQSVVYAEEIHTSEKNGNIGHIGNKSSEFNEIQEELYFVLNDEEITVVEEILKNEDVISNLLKEAIVFQEIEEFHLAVELYDEILSYVYKETQMERKTSKQAVQLIEKFRGLAARNISLVNHYDFQTIPNQSEKMTKEINTEEPIEELLPEQEIVLDNQAGIQAKETSSEQYFSVALMNTKVAEPITSEKRVLYDAVMTRPTDGINTKPYGTEGYELVRVEGDWTGKQVRVTKEAVTPPLNLGLYRSNRY